MQAKSSPLDFVPTSVIKSCECLFADIITVLANLSFEQGCFPTMYKSALVTPLLKKPGLDESNPANFRPISNLNNVSKLLERLFFARFQPHVTGSANFSPLQSAYRPLHSTETAVLHTLNDIYVTADNGNATALVSLDLSAAFDMIEHSILLRRLQAMFGVTGTALSWLQSYLSGRQQSVRSGSATSSPTLCDTGVPQGSVLGPLLFSCYVSPINNISAASGTDVQQYADDTQIYISLNASNTTAQLQTLISCLSALHLWFCHNGLSLNSSKSEFILFGTRQRLQTLSHIDSIRIADSEVSSSNAITTLGLTLDSTLTLNQHVAKIVKSMYYHTRALRHIRSSLTDEMAVSVAVALAQSRLDYANAVLYNTSASNLHRLQSMQNLLARTVLNRAADQSTSLLLRQLHWLPVTYRIKYKLAVITHKVLSTGQPAYLRSLLTFYQPSRSLRSADRQLLALPNLKTEFGRKAFSYASPFIWNEIPVAIRQLESPNAFKSHLKTFYFSKCT